MHLDEASIALWEKRADYLAENDWVIIDDFLPEGIFSVAREFLLRRLKLEHFKQAGIGALGDFEIRKSIRSDRIYWLDRSRDKELYTFYDLVDEVIYALNLLCFLSISGSEFHLAHYPKGAFYRKHLDQFNNRNNRLISMICYLNKEWEPAYGGELRLYRADGTYSDVAPKPGRMVLLKSDIVPHAVLETHVSRYSITGWLLHQPAGVGYLMS